MSAVVLAGLELSVGAEPAPIVSEESELPPSAICHITRATLVQTTASTTTTPTQFFLKASISESQDIVLAAVNATAPTVSLDLTFHADSKPMFSVTTLPELKGEQKSKYTVHLSGFVDVEVEGDEDEDDSDDDGEGEEMTAEEMAAMREAIKRGEYDDMDDDEDGDELEDEDDEDGEDDEARLEGEEDEDEEEEEEEQKQPASAAAGKGKKAAADAAAATAAGNNKRKQAPSTKDNTAAQQPNKQQKTPNTTAANTTQQAPSQKQQTASQKQTKQQPTTTTAASSPAATILPSGLTIQDEVVGSGPEATNGRRVSIRYRGQLVSNGKEFDSNMPRGKPFQFTLGGGECIEGFDKGVKGMRVGGRRVIVVPSELGYGKRGSPPQIPPNAQLKFTIELIKA